VREVIRLGIDLAAMTFVATRDRTRQDTLDTWTPKAASGVTTTTTRRRTETSFPRTVKICHDQS